MFTFVYVVGMYVYFKISIVFFVLFRFKSFQFYAFLVHKEPNYIFYDLLFWGEGLYNASIFNSFHFTFSSFSFHLFNSF